MRNDQIGGLMAAKQQETADFLRCQRTQSFGNLSFGFPKGMPFGDSSRILMLTALREHVRLNTGHSILK